MSNPFMNSCIVTELTKEQIEQSFLDHANAQKKEEDYQKEEESFLESEKYTTVTTCTNFFQKEPLQLTIPIDNPLEMPQICRLTNENRSFFPEEEEEEEEDNYLQETDQTKTNEWIETLLSAYLSNKPME